jgi:hypothetical protein
MDAKHEPGSPSDPDQAEEDAAEYDPGRREGDGRDGDLGPPDRQVFDRYNVTDGEDIAEAMIRTAAYVEGLPSNPSTQSRTSSAVPFGK